MDKINFKKYLPYLTVIVTFIVVVFLLIIVIDKLILPNWIHNVDKVQVPNLIGKTYDDAKQTLENLDLEYTKHLEQFNAEYPENIIINQTPKPNTYVKCGRHILLTVSKGRMTLKMPDIRLMSLRKARVELIRRGIYISNIEYVFNDSIGTDTIISQSVTPRMTVHPDMKINLVVSKGPEAEITVPLLTGKTLPEVEEILQKHNLELGKISNTYEDIFEATFMRNTVVSQFPQAGKLVSKNTKIDITLFR